MMMMIKSKIDIGVDNGGGFEEICSLLRNRGLTSSCGSLSWQVTIIFVIMTVHSSHKSSFRSWMGTDAPTKCLEGWD